jgi:tetratricopeptide (TPR) repeat protein
MVDKVRKKHPDNIAAKILSARIMLRRGQREQAVALLTEVLRTVPDDPEALYRRAQAFSALQKPKLAKADLVKALKVDPNNRRARFMLAMLHARAGEYLQAITQVDRILNEQPGNLTALDMRGRLYLAQGAYTKAQQDFQELIKKAPKSGLGYLRMGILAQAKGERDQAASFFRQALKLDPNKLDALIRLAFMLLERKEANKAVQLVRENLSKMARKDQAHNLLGDIYQADKKYAKSMEQYKAALALNPKMLGSYMGLAAVARAQNDLKAALGYLDKAVELAPLSAATWTARGDLREALGEDAPAAEDYRQALSINPDFIPALNNLAVILTRMGGDKNLNAALPVAQQAKRLSPGDARVSDTMGWLLAKRHTWLGASQELEEAVAQDPKNPTFLYHLAFVYHGMGKSDKAKAALKKALAGGRKFPERREAEELLQSIK